MAMKCMVACLLSLSRCSQAVEYTSEALADRIDTSKLPGAESLSVNFNQFSGYLNVDTRKHLHYWFVESENDPATDPLAFWTNGGPGCSGLIGFLTEQGPFRPTADLKLTNNQFGWNKKANMVFIEAPVGVGFSYSDDTKDYITGDEQTAADNYELIQAFLDRFPHLRANALHLSSESYGGHYIPTLARHIVLENEKSVGTDRWLNFRGIAVGNPYTDPYSGLPAMIDTYWGHQLVSAAAYDDFLTNCDVQNNEFVTGDDNLAFKGRKAIENRRRLMTCNQAIDILFAEAGSLNPYALDYPICSRDLLRSRGSAQQNALLKSFLDFGDNTARNRKLNINEYVPCTPQYASAYLNQNSVKSAIHVKKSITWSDCSDAVWDGYNRNDCQVTSTAGIYNFLIDHPHKLNILIYSGDDDSVCATIGSQKWIWNMGYGAPKTLWAEYLYDSQLAGYYTTWHKTNFTFLTVHNAGHEVPAYQPVVALDMWNKYLAGEWW